MVRVCGYYFEAYIPNVIPLLASTFAQNGFIFHLRGTNMSEGNPEVTIFNVQKHDSCNLVQHLTQLGPCFQDLSGSSLHLGHHRKVPVIRQEMILGYGN